VIDGLKTITPILPAKQVSNQTVISNAEATSEVSR